MNGYQCDTCRAFTPSPAAGWLRLLRDTGERPTLLSPALPQIVGTFCSVRCVADYTYTLLAAGEATAE